MKLCGISLGLLALLCACTHPNKQTTIAILTPVTHRSLEQIEQAFKDTIEADHPGEYRFVTYNAHGNKTLMRSEIEEMARKNYPLVFTLGGACSQMTKEVFAKKKLAIPIVFTCVSNPVGFGIVASEGAPGGSITGVKELIDVQTELRYALAYKPNLRTVLLVFNPMEPGMTETGHEVEKIVETQGLRCLKAEVFQTNEFSAKVTPLMAEADAILVLKDNTAVGGLDTLVKLCNEWHIPLMASDLDSPDRGAAFGYGVQEREFGIEGAKKALLILDQGVKPGDIPVTPAAKFTFKVNRESALLQGIESALLDPAVLR